jgi:hypothetical protein
MLHPMPPERPRRDWLDLAVFLLAMVVVSAVSGFIAWVQSAGVQP